MILYIHIFLYFFISRAKTFLFKKVIILTRNLKKMNLLIDQQFSKYKYLNKIVYCIRKTKYKSKILLIVNDIVLEKQNIKIKFC